MIESQYGILLDKINSTRDYEAVKLAHDQFLSALLAQSFVHMRQVCGTPRLLYEPCHEKASLWGFQRGPTQTELYKHRKSQEARNFGFRE